MLRLLLAAPFVVLLVAFALSNPTPVQLGLWPTDLYLELPLSLAILGFSAVSFFLGALITWLPGVSHRVRAKRAEKKLAVLETHAKAAAAAPSPMMSRPQLTGPK